MLHRARMALRECLEIKLMARKGIEVRSIEFLLPAEAGTLARNVRSIWPDVLAAKSCSRNRVRGFAERAAI
jgi:hypothetical protein